MDVPVLYATTEGHTRRIAEALAARLAARGLDSAAIDVTAPDAERIDWPHMKAVVLGASLHAGAHQRAATRFVRAHRAELDAHPSAFFSVSLSAASTHPDEVEAARRLAEAFPAATGWHPTRVACVAGALAYTRYHWPTRWMMRRIARKEGAPTDTSRDYELTDWRQVDALADEMAGAAQRDVVAQG